MRRRNISRRLHAVKHIPERTCVGCRQVKAKRELVRLVRLADGSVEVDASGRMRGRGAYLCPKEECWQGGLGGGLEHALKITLTLESKGRLISQGKELMQGEN